MSINSIGDLSHSFMLNRQTNLAKTDITRLSQELSTGLKSDTAKVVGNDFSILSAIERARTINESYTRANNEARTFIQAAQAALSTVHSTVSDLGNDLLTTTSAGEFALIDVSATDARARIHTLINTMNTSAAGRQIFSGQASDTPPLASADLMLDALQVEITGATDAQDYQDRIDTWFAPGGGFDTIAYQGSDTAMSSFLIDPDTRISMDVTANAQGIRDALAAMSKVALLTTSNLPNDTMAQRDLLISAGQDMLSAQNHFLGLQANIGVSEEVIDRSATRLKSEGFALDISQNEILEADPFRTATELEAVRNQLESLYVITSRVANLKLTDFLR